VAERLELAIQVVQVVVGQVTQIRELVALQHKHQAVEQLVMEMLVVMETKGHIAVVAVEVQEQQVLHLLAVLEMVVLVLTHFQLG
jgi:hypothetical protein